MNTNNLGTIALTDNKTGNKRIFHFQVDSTRQTRMYAETAGIPHDEYYNELIKSAEAKALSNTDFAIKFLWSALYAGAMRVNRVCDFDYQDVIDMYEDATDEENKEISKVFEALHEAVKKKTQEFVTAMQSVLATQDMEKVMKVMKPAERKIVQDFMTTHPSKA